MTRRELLALLLAPTADRFERAQRALLDEDDAPHEPFTITLPAWWGPLCDVLAVVTMLATLAVVAWAVVVFNRPAPVPRPAPTCTASATPAPTVAITATPAPTATPKPTRKANR